MTLDFRFHPEAAAEFEADIDWYDDREHDLGGRFADAVRAAVDAAVEDPDAWAVWPDWKRDPLVRSKGVTGFPHRVVYFVSGSCWRSSRSRTPNAGLATGAIASRPERAV